MYRQYLSPYIGLLFSIVSLLWFSPVCAEYQNSSIYQEIVTIQNNDSSSRQDIRDQFLTLLNTDLNNENQRIKTIILMELVQLSAQLSDEEATEQWIQALSAQPVEVDEQYVVNFIIEYAKLTKLFYSGQYNDALDYAKNVSPFIGDESAIANQNLVDGKLTLSLNNVGNFYNIHGIIHYNLSQFEEADSLFIKALSYYEQANNRKGISLVYNNLSLISWEMQVPEDALRYMNKAIELAQETKNFRTYILNLVNLGMYYRQLDQFDNAVSSFNKALSSEQINDYPNLVIIANLEFGRVLMTLGNLEKAEMHIQQALLTAVGRKMSMETANARMALADLLVLQGEYQQALRLYDNVGKYYREAGLVQLELGIFKSKSDLYKYQGQYALALQYYEQFHQARVELLEKTQQSSLASLRAKYEDDNKNKQIALLKQENQLNEIRLASNDSQRLLLMIISFSIFTIVVLAISRYYNVKEARRLKRHNAEIASREKQLLLLSNAFKNTSDAVWITNENFEIEAVNNAFVAHTHRNKMSMIGQKVQFAQVKGQDHTLANRIMLQAKLEGSWQGELYDERATGEVYPVELEVEAIKNDNDEVINYLGIFRDITEKRRSQEQLSRLATHDELTNLPNRTLLMELISQSCIQAKYSRRLPTLLVLDVNGFKKINESFGHGTGDQIIQEIGTRLRDTLFNKDVIARLSGAEFAILVELSDPKNSANRVAQKILSCFEQPFVVDANLFNLNIAIGITVYPDDGDNAEELLRKSAMALMDVKGDKTQHYRFFEQHMNLALNELLEKEQLLLNAINNQSFEYHYQPIVNLKSGKISGAEALIRGVNNEQKIIYPDQFIPIAEQARFIDQIDKITIDKVFKQVATWQAQGCLFGPIAINISAQMFSQSTLFIRFLQEKLAQYGIPAGLIKLEITEGTILKNVTEAIETMHELKQLGFIIALDDFGTGYSSLNYLKQFPIDILKIDRSFIMDMHNNLIDRKIIETIISLAKTLNLTVICEGVEIQEHLSLLSAMDCQEYQGYFYSKPLPLAEIEKLVVENQSAVE